MNCWPFRHGVSYRSAQDIENNPDDHDFEIKRARLRSCREHFAKQQKKLEGWNVTGSERLLTMSTTFVGLTCIGLVPALLGTQQFIVDQDTSTKMLWALTALSTVYLFWHFAAHISIPIAAAYHVRIIKNAEITQESINNIDNYVESNPIHVDRVNNAVKYLDTSFLPALEMLDFVVRWGDKIIYAVKILEWILRISVFGLSFSLIVLFFYSAKTEEYEQAGRNQLAFSVWLFIVNVISSLTVAFLKVIDDRSEPQMSKTKK